MRIALSACKMNEPKQQKPLTTHEDQQPTHEEALSASGPACPPGPESVMKTWLIIVLAACSSRSSAPSNGSAAPPPPAPPAPLKQLEPAVVPVDLPAAGVSKLVVHPTIAPSNRITVEWNALRRDASVACREDAYNLVAFDTGDPEGLTKGSHELEWHPEPFVPAPATCEVRFRDEHHRVLARACYQHGRLDPTACALARPKQPESPDAQGINVEGASIHGDARSLTVQALVTKIAEFPPRTFQFALTCDGVKSKLVEETSHLSELEAGDTVFARFTFDLARPLAKMPPDKCQLEITDPKKLATFCIAEGSTEPGPCGT